MALYERVTLELREALAVFVDIAEPEAQHTGAVETPEAIDERGLVSEMVIQHCPMSSKSPFHDGELPPH